MKLLISLLILLPSASFADCPYLVIAEGEDYCVDLRWDYGAKKVKGQFEETAEQTPYLNPMGTVPQKWIYSKALITTWKKSDVDQKFATVPGFRIFPYMYMQNGHSHSAGYEFFLDAADSVYVFERMAFQQMPGCWTLRWTTDPEDLEESSQFLLNMTDFANLNEAQVAKQIMFCDELGGQ